MTDAPALQLDGGTYEVVRQRLDFGIDHQAQRHVEIGGGMHVEAAHALVVLDHRHLAAGDHRADQRFAAARDGEVDGVIARQQQRHQGAVLFHHQLHRIGGQPGAGEAAAHRGGQRAVAVHRLFAATQDAGIARAQAQPSGIDGDIGPALEDDGDHADRHRDLLHRHALGDRPRL